MAMRDTMSLSVHLLSNKGFDLRVFIDNRRPLVYLYKVPHLFQ